MTERVTVEHNGEMITLDVPDGTSDDDIKKFLSGQTITEPTSGIERGVQSQSVAVAARPAVQAASEVAQMPVRGVQDIYNIGRNLMGVQAEGWREMAKHPISTVKAWAQGHPNFGPIIETAREAFTNPQAIKQGMSALGTRAGMALMAPESIMALPYTAAAYQQEKIRANPEAYPNVPYAQVVRGEYPTQGAAGAANRRAVLSRPVGQLSPQEAENLYQSGDQRMIDIYKNDAALSALIRRKAAERVLGPVAP